MQSVGHKLRDARLRNKLSLEQVSAHTRITLKNLHAIEADELSKIGSAFFYKSFVRQFADLVGLNYDKELSSQVQQIVGAMPEPLMPGQGDAPLPKVPSMRPVRAKRFRWLYPLASLIVMLVACSTLYAMWESSKANLGGAVASAASSVVQAFEHARSKLVRSEAGSGTPAAAPASPTDIQTAETKADPGTQDQQPAPENRMDAANAPQSSDPIGDGYRIVLSALERTWLSVTTDGKPAYTGILQATESKVLEGHDSARLRTGNAGGITVVFNGKSIGSLGARGQVITIVFTKNSYEVVEPDPRIAMSRFSPIAEQMLPLAR